MEVAKNESIVLTIDALLDSSPSREFTKEELADRSGLTKKSVDTHINDLVEIGVVEELENRTSKRYSLNNESPIIQKIRQLDSVVQRVRSGDLPKSVSGPLSRDDGNPQFGNEDYENPIDDMNLGSDGLKNLDNRSVNEQVEDNGETFSPAAD
jgi:DNA-binding transcriptional ArsR family regulator